MQDLKARTKKFALDVIRFCRTLPRDDEFTIIKRQLIRSATSTAANYRAAQRAKSKPDFINKIGTSEEEADESLFLAGMHCRTIESRAAGTETTAK